MTDNLSIRLYLNEIENRIIFKTKTGYYLELLSPETRKLHGNGKSVPNLEITEVYYSIAMFSAMITNRNQKSC